MNRPLLTTCLLAGGSAGIALLMVIYPKTAIASSLSGLRIWWEHVFPALFPFFVLSELMIGFGVVTFAGMLFEPVMRPIFRVPGNGAFVFIMGLISGFPAGARMTARLYEEKRLTKTEAERLSSFTSFSNPLFLFGVTAIGFFGQPSLGVVIALSHYAGNIGVGLIMRRYRPEESGVAERRSMFPFFSKALRSMHEERMRRWRPFGKMLGEAVISSVTTLLAIGGFIALFAMLTGLFSRIHLTDQLGTILSFLLGEIGFSPVLGQALVPGIFELTIGANELGSADAPLLEKTVLVSALLGFCGFSIQAQAVSILAQAGLSARPFLIGRVFHAFFSSIAAFVFYHVFHISKKISSTSVDAPANPAPPLEWSGQEGAGSLFTLIVLVVFILILFHRMRRNQSR